MDMHPILGPMLVQMFLMIALAFWLIWARVGSVMRGKVKLRDVRDNGWQGWIKNAGDNFDNQYQIPLLFFVVCLTVLITNTSSSALVFTAWLFAAFRVVHALIHISYNNITHRFLMFLISTLALIAMIVQLALAVI